MKTILFLLLIFLTSCNLNNSYTVEGPLNGTDAEDGTASLRIQNIGNIDFQSVKIGFTGPVTHYGELTAGKVSEYKSFEEVYRYGYIEVEADGKVYKLVPVDYVGESPLEPGQYTYELIIEEDDLLFRFVK